jgi:hypothetical protein
MLSHPANSEDSAVAAEASLEPAAKRENRRRHITVEEILPRLNGEYFRNWFIDGPRLLLKGKFSRRAAAFMIVAAIPAIAAVLFMTLPGLLFPTPAHNAFFYFAKGVTSDIASLVPLALGLLSTIFSLRFPLGS